MTAGVGSIAYTAADDDNTNIGANNPLAGATAVTISMWMNRNDDTDNSVAFLSRGFDTSLNFIIDGSGGHVEILFKGTGGHFIRSSDTIASTLLPDDQWLFVTYTWDYNSGSPLFKLRINGTNHATSYRVFTDVISDISTGTGDFKIAGMSGFSAYAFGGKLAHVHLYDRALSDAEIEEIRYKPASVANNLQAYWPLSELAAKDLSGNGFTGTNGGAAVSTDGPPVYFP